MKYYALEYFRGGDESIVDARIRYSPPRSDYYDIADSEFTQNEAVSFDVLGPLKNLKEDFFRVTSGEFLGVRGLAEVIRSFQNDVQLVPAVGRNSNGSAVEGEFCLIHPGKRVAAFNYAESDYAGKSMILSEVAQGRPGRLVKGITHVVLSEKGIEGNSYFFLANAIFFNPIVSADLLDELLARKFDLSYQMMDVA